jgi:hypothetical protein
MFLSAPANPTKAKHVIYLCATTLLGVLFSVLAHVGIESLYLNWADGASHIVHWYWGCALHPVIQIGLPILGAIGGFFLGRTWWKWVYVDRKWAKRV